MHSVASAVQLSPMLHIDWQRLTDYPAQGPEGMLGSNGGWIDDNAVLSSFGYAAGKVFTNTSWVLNVSSAQAADRKSWKQLPAAPVTPRQDLGVTKVPALLTHISLLDSSICSCLVHLSAIDDQTLQFSCPPGAKTQGLGLY